MTHPAVGSFCDELMFFARGARRSDTTANAAEQPVNSAHSCDTDDDSKPAHPFRKTDLGPGHPGRVDQVHEWAQPKDQPSEADDCHKNCSIYFAGDFFPTLSICLQS